MTTFSRVVARLFKVFYYSDDSRPMMISRELSDVLGAARSVLSEDPEWELLNSIPPGVSRSPSLDAPRDYLDFLEMADGIIAGSFVILDSKFFTRMQSTIEAGMTEVPLGCRDWSFVGKVNENPVLVSRADGTVWGFADMASTWWESADFRKYAETFEGFILEYGFGPSYRALSSVDEGDQWLRLLRRLGRVV